MTICLVQTKLCCRKISHVQVIAAGVGIQRTILLILMKDIIKKAEVIIGMRNKK